MKFGALIGRLLGRSPRTEDRLVEKDGKNWAVSDGLPQDIDDFLIGEYDDDDDIVVISPSEENDDDLSPTGVQMKDAWEKFKDGMGESAKE